MNIKINQVLDTLIPRGGEPPKCIYVSLEEYLSRISNLSRKIQGLDHRIKCWENICAEHKDSFKKELKSKGRIKLSGKFTKFTYSFRDTRLENEFEVLLYSILSTLSALTRVVACFLKSSTTFHSHSKLSAILLKDGKLKKSQEIVLEACNTWVNELTDRRDAATHYIALSITSFLERSKGNSSRTKKLSCEIAVSKAPLKYNSIWEDTLPIRGGAQQKSMFGIDENNNNIEVHELLDSHDKVLVRRDKPLPKKPEVIDGEKFMKKTRKKLDRYLISMLGSLNEIIRSNSS